jgi:hypothetical protein
MKMEQYYWFDGTIPSFQFPSIVFVEYGSYTQKVVKGRHGSRVNRGV